MIHESDRTFDSYFKIAKEEESFFLFSITLGPYNDVENPFKKWMLWHSARQTSSLTRALNERQSNNRKINKLFCITTEKLVWTEKISFHVYVLIEHLIIIFFQVLPLGAPLISPHEKILVHWKVYSTGVYAPSRKSFEKGVW